MKLLVLGGTLFLGRHVVDDALRRGWNVNVFTRGQRSPPWPHGVTALAGDRDPRATPGLAALQSGTWDAVIDTSGYVPRVVDASARLLHGRVRRYVFVSTVSVYASLATPGVNEDAPVATLGDATTEDVPKHYGALKAACESVVCERFGDAATIVRPGLIVGPHDPTDRFAYWPARFVHPHLLGGERARRAVVPGPPTRPVQVVDARDLAAFLLDVAARDVAGTFNACSPAGRFTFGDVIDACLAVADAPPEPAWVDDATLLAHHVAPWTGIPLWIPATEADAAGFMAIDAVRAQAAGLVTRALVDTVRDTTTWLAGRADADAWRSVLSDSRERLILAARDAGRSA